MPLRHLFSSRAAAALTLRVSRDGAGTVVIVRGELEMTTTHLLTELVDAVARPPAGDRLRLVLDLWDVTFFGADGVNALIHARGAVASVSGRLVLRAPSPIVRRVLDITGDNPHFMIQQAVDTPGPPPAVAAGRRTRNRRTPVLARARRHLRPAPGSAPIARPPRRP